MIIKNTKRAKVQDNNLYFKMFNQKGLLLKQTNGTENVYKYNACDKKVYLFDKQIGTLEEVISGPINTITQRVYSQLVNKYFKTLSINWTFGGDVFRKMSNFVEEKSTHVSKLLPIHSVKVVNSIYDMHLVMYRGKLYYALFKYWDGVALLHDFYTLQTKWSRIRNLAPIWNVSKKCFV